MESYYVKRNFQVEIILIDVCLTCYYRRDPVGCKDYVLPLIMEVIPDCKRNFLARHNHELFKFRFKFSAT
jgi:hypothetical protein